MSDSRLPDQLSAFDQLMHRGEANPRTRSGIIAVEILDTTPDWDRYRLNYEYASRSMLRLRQKVVTPTLPTASPRWVVDPDFNLDFHVRRLRVPEPGTLRQVFDMVEVVAQSPLDNSRPLWSATLIEGLPDGGAAQLVHLSHAVADAVGGVEMFAQIYDLERDPEPTPPPPLPIPEDLTPNDLMRDGFNHMPASIVGGMLGAVTGTAKLVGRVVTDPMSAVNGAVGYARSGARVAQQAADPSPLLRRRSLSTRSEAIDIKLSDLHAAAKAAGGSINDAYLAGLSAALRMYHDQLGLPISYLRMAVPVNLRADADPAGGNRFAGVNLAAPIGVVDPTERIQKIREQMIKSRDEPAIDMIGSVAPVLSILPSALLEAMSGNVIAADVQASNIPIYPGDTFIAGAKVLRQYGIGPVPGIAMMAVLISRSGWATVTVRYDRASVTREALFAQCLLDGFNEVLALTDDPDALATPASFTEADA